MNQPTHNNSADVLAQLDIGAGQATLLARNLSDANFRWVIAGLGGGSLGIWFLKEVGEFVLRLLELQLRYGV